MIFLGYLFIQSSEVFNLPYVKKKKKFPYIKQKKLFALFSKLNFNIFEDKYFFYIILLPKQISTSTLNDFLKISTVDFLKINKVPKIPKFFLAHRPGGK